MGRFSPGEGIIPKSVYPIRLQTEVIDQFRPEEGITSKSAYPIRLQTIKHVHFGNTRLSPKSEWEVIFPKMMFPKIRVGTSFPKNQNRTSPSSSSSSFPKIRTNVVPLNQGKNVISQKIRSTSFPKSDISVVQESWEIPHILRKG